MSISVIISLFGGLALFLYGMRLMGDGLKNAAGGKMKRFLSLMTKNRVMALLTGLCVTAIIQSSGATTVMVVGFVNAQMLTLTQSIGVILGANIGTTVTSLLLSVSFNPSAIFAIIGILLVMFFEKKETLRLVGQILLGLGVLFTGMNLMSGAMEPLRESDTVRTLFSTVDQPVPAILVGILITALLQSSSVSVGIIQVMAAGGLITVDSMLFLIVGAQVGACTPTMLSMMNTSVSAKRTAMVHLLFNLFKCALVLLLTLFLPLPKYFASITPDNPKLTAAYMHIGINIVAALVILPCMGILEKLAVLLIRGKDEPTRDIKMVYYDPRLLRSPILAAEQLYREVCRMGREAHTHIQLAMTALCTADISKAEEIEYHEALSDYLEEAITEGLVAVMPLELSEHESHRIANLFHVVNDIERISDHAQNLYGLAMERIEREADFSETAVNELKYMFDRVIHIMDSALEGLEEWNMPDSIHQLIESAEEIVDENTKKLREEHIERLKDRKCLPKSGIIYLEALNNLERIADHSVNIASAPRDEISVHSHEA